MLVIGLIIGANLGIIFMCILQINRDSKLKVRINNVKKYIYLTNPGEFVRKKRILELLGEEVYDE